MTIGLILLILLLVIFFLVSAAVIFHLYRYTPEKNNAAFLIAVYVGVSFLLIITCLVAFGRIEWEIII